MRPFLNMIDDETAEQILQEAFLLLQNPGVRVHNTQALDLLAEAGAKVDRDTQIAFIPEELVHRSLATCPQEFFLYNLNGQACVHYGANDVHFDPGSAAIRILDSVSQKPRPANTHDFVNFVKLVEMLPQIDAQSTAIICADVPEEIGDLYRLYIALNYMTKPIVTGAFRKDTWWIMKELLVAVAGSEEQLSNQPIAVFDVCPSPPLLWSDLTCQNLIDCARSAIPAELVSMPLAGATAPVTLAAAVVQHAAENLSGIVIHQLAKPGSPIVWGGSPAAFDMRHGTTPMGAVETWMIDCAYVQVGKSLSLPTHAYLGMSDAKIVDTQCGLEAAGGAMLAALAGVNMVSGAGMLDFESCQSYEKLVIDAEYIGMLKRLLAGVQIREQPIALNLMREMGHKAEYLAHPHTLQYFQQEQYIPSKVIDRMSFDAWQSSGAKNTFSRAADIAQNLIKNYQPYHLDEQVRKELHAITARIAVQNGLNTLPQLPLT